MTEAPDWLEQARRLVSAVGSTLGAASGEDGAGARSADCRWCPICQAAAVVRGERPEVTDALADVLTAAAAALRAASERASAPAPEADPAPPPAPPVQHIEIG